ncbi:hypothetical protein WJX73_001465 [Symbiochloris irregularis]|uniref:LAGLIDADG homing endonuclease n=1 Tax=Symbiochloris irregularis TaxID=706552 RepID=A0AAW1NQY4_9CHLO
MPTSTRGRTKRSVKAKRDEGLLVSCSSQVHPGKVTELFCRRFGTIKPVHVTQQRLCQAVQQIAAPSFGAHWPINFISLEIAILQKI